VGKRNKDYLKYYGVPERRLFFSPHFVENDFFSEGAEQARANGETARIRSRFGIPEEAFVFLFMGRMEPVKRAEDFIRACRKIFDDSPHSNVHALLVGDGTLRKDLEQLARPDSERIHFSGFQGLKDLPAYYGAADAVVVSSQWESWCRVVNEALASALPVVASHTVGSAPDLIEEGRTGLTYPMGNISALVERMLALKKICEGRKNEIRLNSAEKISGYSLQNATAGLVRAIEAVTHRRCEVAV
jgi:glycosyltransferase involved in cell wall biosynthesis